MLQGIDNDSFQGKFVPVRENVKISRISHLPFLPRSDGQGTCHPLKEGNTFHPDNPNNSILNLSPLSDFLENTHLSWGKHSPDSCDLCLANGQVHSSQEKQAPENKVNLDMMPGTTDPHCVDCQSKFSHYARASHEEAFKTISKLPPGKLKAIEFWIQTGQFGLSAHRKKGVTNPSPSCFIKTATCMNHAPEINRYKVLAPFLQNFQHSYVLKIQISGTFQLCVVDTGAHRSMLSYPKYKEIFPKNSLAHLNPIDDTTDRFFGVDGNRLHIHGILQTTIAIGPLKCAASFVVYDAPHSEILLAHDILKTYKLLLSDTHLYIPDEILRPTQEKMVHRVSLEPNIYLPLFSTQNVTILPGTNQVIPVYVDLDKEKITGHQLAQNPVVCHSEDVQGTSDEKIMQVYFQLCEMDHNGKTEILYSNKTSEIVFLLPGELVGHSEQMFSISDQAISSYGSNLMKHIYNVIQFSDETSQKPMSLQNFFLDSDKKVPDFAHPPCEGDDLELNSFMKKLCLKYKNIFSTSTFDVGQTKTEDQVSFTLNSNVSPVNEKPYPVNLKLHEKAMAFISHLLDLGIFKHADQKCQFASPAFFMLKSPILDQVDAYDQKYIDEDQMKKDLPVRLIVNYVKINKKIKKNFSVHPQITVRDALNRMRGAKIACKMDISNCYYHLRVKESKCKYMSFCYSNLHITPTVVMHGLILASSLWATIFAKIIRKANLEKYLVILVDDVLVTCQNRGEYMFVMEKLFKTLQEANFKVKFQKCKFNVVSSFSAFGWTISLKDGGTIMADSVKLNALKALPRPRNIKEARKFTGKFGFYAEALPRIHHILSPIFKLCSQNVKFTWSPACEKSYIQALESLGKIQLLFLPNFNASFYLSCDAARGSGISHTIWQRHPKTHLLCPVKHASMSLQKTVAMSNWSQNKSEAFAMFWAASSNYVYLVTGPNFIFTDCRSLVWMSHWRFSNHQVFSWQLLLGQLDLFVIALKADSALIQFQDAFTRPKKTFVQTDNKLKNLKFNDKVQLELPVIDFSGLPPVRPGVIISCIDKFLNWAKQRTKSEIKKTWQQYTEEVEHLPQITNLVFVRQTLVFTKGDKNPFWKVTDPWAPGRTVESQFENVCQVMLNYFPQLTIDKLSQLQADDKLCSKMMSDIAPPYFIFSSILFKKVNTNYLLVLPKSLTEDVVRFFHTFQSCWHLKQKKLFNLLRQTFVLQGFNRAYNKVMELCKFCHLHTPIRHKRPIPLGLSFVPRRPLMLMNLDFVILDSSFKKYPAILTCCCPFSYFTIFIACNDKCTDEEIIKIFMERIVAHYGFVKGIGTDCQASLVSTRVQIWAQMMGIAKYESTSPTGNVCERQNKIVIQLFQAFQKYSPLSERLAPIFATFATLLVNSVPVQPFNVSPNTLVWGSRPKPSFSETHCLSTLLKADDFQPYFQQYKLLQNVFLQIKKAIMMIYAKKKKLLDQYMNNCHVGDLVLLQKLRHNTRVGHKLKPRFYEFPFLLVKKYAKSALLRPILNSKIVLHPLKQRGKKAQTVKCILVSLERLKKVKNELPFLNLTIPQQLFLKLAQILNEKQSTQQVKFTAVNSQPEGGGEIQKFLKSINTQNLLINDVQTTFFRKNAENFINFAKGIHIDNPQMIFTHENVISLRSNPVPSHMTCSYEMESLVKNQGESHTFDEKTDFSALKHFLDHRKSKLPVFKPLQGRKQSNIKASETYFSDTSYQSVPAEIAANDFEDYLTASSDQSRMNDHFSSASQHSSGDSIETHTNSHSSQSDSTSSHSSNSPTKATGGLAFKQSDHVHKNPKFPISTISPPLNNSSAVDVELFSSVSQRPPRILQFDKQSTPPGELLTPDGGSAPFIVGAETDKIKQTDSETNTYTNTNSNTGFDVNTNTNTKTNTNTNINIQSDSHSSRSEKVRLKVTMQNPQHLISDEGMKSSRPDSSLSAQLPYSNVEKKSTDKH